METMLDAQQERFVAEYLKDSDAGAAAVRAGYTQGSPLIEGAALMRDPLVREHVRAATLDLLARCGCSALGLVGERMRAAFFRARNLFDEHGAPLPIHEIDEDTAAALQVSIVWRPSGPVLRLAQPNRSVALAAIERVQARLERQQEQHYLRSARQAREQKREQEREQAREEAWAAAHAPPPEVDPNTIVLDIHRYPNWSRYTPPEAAANADAALAAPATPAAPAAAPPAPFRENPQVLSGGRAPTAAPVAAPPAQISEKPQVLSGWEAPAEPLAPPWNGRADGWPPVPRRPSAEERAAARRNTPPQYAIGAGDSPFYRPGD